MSDKFCPQLSVVVKRLFTQEGGNRLTEDELIQLQTHLTMICRWADQIPSTTEFFFVDWQPILVLPRVQGMEKSDLAIAAYLQPIHSQLCAIAMQVLWKADQLIRTLCTALNAGDLIVAATMARSLIEISASFGYESHEISNLWRERKSQPAPDIDSLAEFHNKITQLVGQIMFGTKLKRDGKPETGIERINILSLVDKAGKVSEALWIRRVYDVLCDTVHPSIGSNRCFWNKEPTPEDGHIFTFISDRKANGIQGDLPFTIGKGTFWALTWLGWMWVLFERTRNDLCLTAKLYALPRSYYGIIHPDDPSGFCRCGSQEPSSTCNHEFGNVPM